MPTGAVPLSGAGVISRRPSRNFLNLVPAAASTTLNPAAALTDNRVVRPSSCLGCARSATSIQLAIRPAAAALRAEVVAGRTRTTKDERKPAEIFCPTTPSTYDDRTCREELRRRGMQS
jgi:hypothetical protein